MIYLGIWKIAKDLPSGKRLHNSGKSQLIMGKLTISMAIFNSFLYICLREGSRFWYMDEEKVTPDLDKYESCKPGGLSPGMSWVSAMYQGIHLTYYPLT